MRVLKAADQLDVRKAVVLLRLARALNQSRQNAITNVTVRMRREQVWLELDVKRGRGELERWALDKEKNHFRDVFGRELLVAED